MKAFFSLLLLLGFISAQANDLVKYELKVGEFNELKVVDGINVVYSNNADSIGLAVFTCPSSQASKFMFNNDKGKLTMQLSTEGVGLNNLPVIYVYSTYLTHIENSGDSLVRVSNITKGPKFSAKLVGNGRISVHGVEATEVKASFKTGHGSVAISGKCEQAKFSFTGIGVIQADALESKTASVKASGTGSIGLWATEKLTVSGVGSTTIYYKGNPEVKNRTIGMKILPLEQ